MVRADVRFEPERNACHQARRTARGGSREARLGAVAPTLSPRGLSGIFGTTNRQRLVVAFADLDRHSRNSRRPRHAPRHAAGDRTRDGAAHNHRARRPAAHADAQTDADAAAGPARNRSRTRRSSSRGPRRVRRFIAPRLRNRGLRSPVAHASAAPPPASGDGEGAGDTTGAGSPGEGGNGTGGGANEPCGGVTFADHGPAPTRRRHAFFVDVRMSVSFPDGHTESTILDYPFYYSNAAAEPMVGAKPQQYGRAHADADAPAGARIG